MNNMRVDWRTTSPPHLYSSLQSVTGYFNQHSHRPSFPYTRTQPGILDQGYVIASSNESHHSCLISPGSNSPHLGARKKKIQEIPRPSGAGSFIRIMHDIAHTSIEITKRILNPQQSIPILIPYPSSGCGIVYACFLRTVRVNISYKMSQVF